MTSSDERLSAAGEARGREILETVLRAARRQRKRRLAVRGAIMLLPCALAGMLIIHRNPPEVAPPIVAQQSRENVAGIRVEFVRDEPGIAKRLAAPESRIAVEYLDDERLLDLLARGGHSAGIVRSAGRVTLVLDGEM
jgi:hypothetical protein